jgi:hypothetical protein
MECYSIRITVANTAGTETLGKTILEAVGTKNHLRILQRMVRGIVHTAELSLTYFPLVHLPHCIRVISKTIIGPTAVLLQLHFLPQRHSVGPAPQVGHLGTSLGLRGIVK